MLKKFIERPVLSTVISIIILILGILGLIIIPVTQYPDIAPTTVQISTSYPGANAKTIMESVIIPIEEQVNGVEGMDYIQSTASNNGSATTTVVFKPGVNGDVAQVNVQNRVARATPLLPAEVTRSGVVTQKQQTSALMYAVLSSTNPKYNGTFIQNYLNINIIPALKRVSGVGDASVFGAMTYSMRIWLDPSRMANYGLIPTDVVAALSQESLEAAAGALGQNAGQSFEYSITYSGRYKTEEQYRNIVIKSLNNGQILRLRDVADIEFGAQTYSSTAEMDGDPSSVFAVFQTPGSNAQQIIKNLRIELEKASKQFPEGITYTILMDTNTFLDASIDKVVHTMIEAFILVFIVVYIFLQDFRSTLVPLIAVPISIIGTFFFLNLAGFSLNLLTLFALVLAIGIVVDDAIVVVEAVHARMEFQHEGPVEATKNAMDEISGAIISITLVMCAVFIPVTFISGPTGVFYKQFGITLIVSILISALNALTLSPALCALFLKPHKKEEGHKRNFIQRFFDSFNTYFNILTNKYGNSFKFLVKNKWISLLIIIISGIGIYSVNKIIPSGFVPTEDNGFIIGNIELPVGASMDRVYKVEEQFQEKIKNIPGVDKVTIITGNSIINGAGSNYGMTFIKLKPFEERTTPDLAVQSIIGKLFGVAAQITDAQMIFFQPPAIPGFGMSSGFELKLMDKTGGDINDFNKVANEYVGALMQRPEIQYAQSSLNTNYPQYELSVNVERAKQSGVSVSSILSTLQGYIGGLYAADFSRFGKQYRVYIQSLPSDRINEMSLNKMYVKTVNGSMTPVSQFITLKRVYGPNSVNRFNLFTNTNITGAVNPGYSTGDAIAAINEINKQILTSSYSTDFSGLTREEVNSGSQTLLIFGLCIVFVYFILSAQYESYILPFSVLLSVPCGIMGSYLAQWLAGLQNNIYFQISLIMLVGLLAKNAILIVEFALQRRSTGMTIVKAAIDGAKARLRPILMTSFAFILGLMPLVVAQGVSSAGNRSVGTGAAFGLLIGTVLGLFVIPVLFIVFQSIQEKIKPLKFDDTQENIELHK